MEGSAVKEKKAKKKKKGSHDWVKVALIEVKLGWL